MALVLLRISAEDTVILSSQVISSPAGLSCMVFLTGHVCRILLALPNCFGFVPVIVAALILCFRGCPVSSGQEYQAILMTIAARRQL